MTKANAAQAKPSRSLSRVFGNYSFIFIFIAILLAYLWINGGATTWSGVMNILRHSTVVGVIAFVGLVIPHVLRLLRSSDYTFLVPASVLLGATVMEVTDIVARLVVRPAELPVGIITAVVGAPVFLLVLLRGVRRAAATTNA